MSSAKEFEIQLQSIQILFTAFQTALSRLLLIRGVSHVLFPTSSSSSRSTTIVCMCK
ncbi:hypothetical protein X975_12673, partial [Stegodyphus mimosarum]